MYVKFLFFFFCSVYIARDNYNNMNDNIIKPIESTLITLRTCLGISKTFRKQIRLLKDICDIVLKLQRIGLRLRKICKRPYRKWQDKHSSRTMNNRTLRGLNVLKSIHYYSAAVTQYEPCHEKTCLRGLIPGKTTRPAHREKLARALKFSI